MVCAMPEGPATTPEPGPIEADYTILYFLPLPSASHPSPRSHLNHQILIFFNPVPSAIGGWATAVLGHLETHYTRTQLCNSFFLPETLEVFQRLSSPVLRTRGRNVFGFPQC